MKITKWTLAAALMLAGLANLQPPALAQEKPDAAKPTAPRRERPGQAGDRLERMTKELNLSDEQKGKLKTLFEQQAAKTKAMRDDTSLTQEQRREKARAIREEFTGKIKEVLTKEQNEKWQKQQQDRPPRQPRTEQPK